MNSKYESEFVNSFVVKDEPKYEWIAAKLHIKASEFVDFLRKHKDHINENNGFMSIDILRAQKDRNKMYAKFTKINKQALKDEPTKKVETSEFMPDREAVKNDEDLPF
ncbi:MAG: hypothetical protein EBY39_03175 [Flavobacteriia bacterium]|nr:hypothetical protein [Flavobacteriia bacterium]